MPSGQFNTVVISVSDILPLDKGHYISVIENNDKLLYNNENNNLRARVVGMAEKRGKEHLIKKRRKLVFHG